MHSVRGWKAGLAFFVLCIAVVAAPAQTFTTLLSFNEAMGGNPGPGSLVQGIDGNLYGVAFYGGLEGDGTVLKITPAGTLSRIHSFRGTADGSHPTGLVLDPNGNLYGTTLFGGAQSSTCDVTGGCGTVFGFTSAGTIFTMHTFNGLDGSGPNGLTLGSDGNLYGTTQSGTIFKISPNSGFKFTVLHILTTSDGVSPNGPLVQGDNGNFYGTAPSGGLYGYGTTFEIFPTGTFAVTHNFDYTDGSAPAGALVQGTNGDFYGVTAEGGGHGDGTVFFAGPGGSLHKLYDLQGGSNGGDPTTGLVLGSDGNFYGGTNAGGGGSGTGELFEVTPGGVLTGLHAFNGAEGGGRYPTLMQATTGIFYGTTLEFGANSNCPENGCGTAFTFSNGLGPFVAAVPPSRGVGTKVLLLGQGFTGTTSVAFNGVSAEFTVNSDTEITTFVPTGATTGNVQVTTPTGTLSTKVLFVVP
jgi:uncharacterized repeat protein (TIGR03803 family)